MMALYDLNLEWIFMIFIIIFIGENLGYTYSTYSKTSAIQKIVERENLSGYGRIPDSEGCLI